MVGVAHVHAPGYARAFGFFPQAKLTGVWDENAERAQAFGAAHGLEVFDSQDALLEACDAAVIASENVRHAPHIRAALEAGRHVLCEKPLVTDLRAGRELVDLANAKGLVLMTAFPCPFSPAFQKVQGRFSAGEIGELVGICATNRGQCPGGWFVEESLSGGGAMIDHTVHVADLLRRLLGKDPTRVSAMIGNRMFGRETDDTALLTLDYDDGLFATLDASWSRPKSYKTWGDVTLNLVGTEGVIEADLFGPAIDLYSDRYGRHETIGYGADLDRAMAREFLCAIEENRDPFTSGEDGLAATAVALAGYESARRGEPVQIGM